MSSQPILGVLASGRGSNCEAILDACHRGDLDARVGVVLSDNPEAPVLDTARRFGVPARWIDPGRRGARLTPEQETAYVAALREAKVTWVALAGFMRILGPPLLDAFAGRILNIHPSLLPAFPGLDGVGQAYRYGVKVAGCTVHLVDEGVDTGPVVAQTAVEVPEGITEEKLRERILCAEHATYVRALRIALGGRFRIEGRRIRCPQ